MSDYDNTNRGILSRNERRETDSHPEFTGSINVGGVEYWLNAWVKERKSDGGKFFSLSVKPKEAQVERPAPARARQDEQFSDEIPF